MAIRLAGEDYIAKHADLEGLAADDHTLYVLRNILTTKGDLFLRGASAIERLAIGTKRFFPRVNEAGDAPEYVKGYEFGQYIRPWQWELDFYEWTTTLTGTGAVVAKAYGVLRIRTGTTAGSTARGSGYSFAYTPFWNVDDFEWYCKFIERAGSTNGQLWLKIDEDTAADPVKEAVGWRVDDHALKGIVHNGASLTVVDLSVTLPDNVGYDLFLKFIPGDKVEWYVNGDLKGSSTNIPTAGRAANGYPILAVANNGDASQNDVEIQRHGWILGA